MTDSKLFAYVGFISGLVTIVDCIVRTVRAAQFTVSSISVIALVVCIIAVIIHCVVNDEVAYYNIKKNICYFMGNKGSYIVENKECIYTYKSRTEMEHTKNHDIVCCVNNLKHFCDKFKWSKEQSIDEINIKSNNPHQKVTVSRVENWHQYTVEFDELGRGQKQSISITISDLKDPQKEALPFLSSNITCKTKKLRLVVIFKDDKLKPINIKYKIFDNYASAFPLIQENLNYNVTEQKIEKIENKPIYGYRYVITWDFEND